VKNLSLIEAPLKKSKPKILLLTWRKEQIRNKTKNNPERCFIPGGMYKSGIKPKTILNAASYLKE
jgi:hypothetical protein